MCAVDRDRVECAFVAVTQWLNAGYTIDPDLEGGAAEDADEDGKCNLQIPE